MNSYSRNLGNPNIICTPPEGEEGRFWITDDRTTGRITLRTKVPERCHPFGIELATLNSHVYYRYPDLWPLILKQLNHAGGE